MRYIWKIKRGKYSVNHGCYYGKWCIANYWFNGLDGSTAGKEYKIYIELPGIKKSFYAETEEKAKEKIEEIANYWFKEGNSEV